jgi:hypothetical protein
LFYQKSIQAWTTFLQCVQKVETKTDILHVRLFGNCNITFQNKPLIFSSFPKGRTGYTITKRKDRLYNNQKEGHAIQ